METKRCPRCNQEKAFGEFAKCRTTKSGLQVYCRACAHDHYTENRDRVLARCREYAQTARGREVHRAANERYGRTEEGREVRRRQVKKYLASPQGRAWKQQYTAEYFESPEHRAARNASSARSHLVYDKTPAGRAAQVRARRNYASSEKGRAAKGRALAKYKQTAKWRDVNERYRRSEKWRSTHQRAVLKWVRTDKGRESRHRRRARKRAATSDLTQTDRRFLRSLPCVYCGLHLPPMEIDHLIPLGPSGPDTMSNVVPACRSCNAKKFARTPMEAKMPLVYIPDHLRNIDLSGIAEVATSVRGYVE